MAGFDSPTGGWVSLPADITLGFFLVLLSAGTPLSQRIAVHRAAVAQRENPTPENMQAVQLEKDKVTHRQYLICGLAVLNVIVIIVYGALQQRKRLA
jgi:hypothetical protein